MTETAQMAELRDDAQEGTARAAVLHEFGGALAVERRPIPKPGPDALVVRVLAATVCGSDVHLREGVSAQLVPTELPLIPGHEIVGEVVELGPHSAVDSLGQKVAVGSRVIWTPVPCRRCHTCTVLKRTNHCPNLVVGMHSSCDQFPYLTGGFAEMCYVPAGAGRVVVPDDVPDHWAAAASCAVRSAVRAVAVSRQPTVADHVFVQGAGPLGLFVTAILSTLGVASVTVSDADTRRLELARRWGATDTINVSEIEPDARRALLLGSADGRGPDLAFECSGAPGAVAEGISVLATGGSYVLAGTVVGAPQSVDVARICARGLEIRGSFSAEIDDYWRALEFLRRHAQRFDWDALFGRRYDLEQAGDALEAMRGRAEIKPVVVPAKEIA